MNTGLLFMLFLLFIFNASYPVAPNLGQTLVSRASLGPDSCYPRISLSFSIKRVENFSLSPAHRMAVRVGIIIVKMISSVKLISK